MRWTRPIRDRRLPLAALGAAALLALGGCGRKPVPPAPCGVLGIDVARHQGVVDWPRVAAAGVRFAWIKATEGGDYLDPSFKRNWLLAPAAGVRRGAYHFIYWCRAAADQARWFVANVPADPDALPPVLDVEWNPGSRTCPNKVERTEALATVTTIVDAMERAYGRRPILYVPADMYADVIAGSFADYPLWVRAIDEATPSQVYGPRDWTVWQWKETGRVDGIAVDVDLDCVKDVAALR